MYNILNIWKICINIQPHTLPMMIMMMIVTMMIIMMMTMIIIMMMTMSQAVQTGSDVPIINTSSLSLPTISPMRCVVVINAVVINIVAIIIDPAIAILTLSNRRCLSQISAPLHRKDNDNVELDEDRV